MSPESGTGPHVLAGRLRLCMVRLSRQLRRMDPSEFTIAQMSALATVVVSGPLGVGRLAEIEALPSPAATRLADKLERSGLVTRQPNPTDRRGVQLRATEAGVQLFQRRVQIGTAWLSEQLGTLEEADRRAVERAVSVLESFATEHLGEDVTERNEHKETPE